MLEKRFDRKLYMGVVEENNDPNRKGRLKVRVQSMYNNIPLDDIPWASPFMDLAGKEYKIPAIGKIVNVLFLTNDIYDPYYIYSENYNINLENKLNALSDNEYVDFVAMLFDERTQIHATSEEFTLDHLYNKITINNESINHELKDNSQLLNLGDRGAGQDAILGNHWIDWFDQLVNILLQPTSLLGNQSAPIVRPQLDAHLQLYQQIRDTFLSKHVKIVDNMQVTKLDRDPRTDTTKEDKSLVDNTFKISSVGYDTNKNVQDLQDRIERQNKKACQQSNNSKPSSQLPQPETEGHENNFDFVPSGGSYEQRYIDGQLYIVTDENREELDNLEKSLSAGEELQNYTPSGDYHGQNYYIEGYYNEQSKVYNPEEIENMEVTIPESDGLFDTYLSGEQYKKLPGIKFKNQLVIENYYPAIKKMVDAAKSDGVTITLNDAFRKYEDQFNLRIQNAPYNKKSDNKFLTFAAARQFNPATGRPGWSRHHFGIAFDISTNGGKNSAYKWLEKNALSFGFIRTVKSETWHWEYKPWETIPGSNIKPWDKYAIVPKGHYTWNDTSEEEDAQIANINNRRTQPPDIREC